MVWDMPSVCCLICGTAHVVSAIMYICFVIASGLVLVMAIVIIVHPVIAAVLAVFICGSW